MKRREFPQDKSAQRISLGWYYKPLDEIPNFGKTNFDNSILTRTVGGRAPTRSEFCGKEWYLWLHMAIYSPS